MSAGLWEWWLGCWSGASRADMHTCRHCCKMDACWTVATQSPCGSFVTLSAISVGMDCLTFSRAYWCDASLKANPSDVVPYYQPCQLVGCLIIGHAFWCGAPLSAMPVGVVPHYRQCLLMWCLTIGHVFWCGASLSAMPTVALPLYRSCLPVRCLIISHILVWCPL